MFFCFTFKRKAILNSFNSFGMKVLKFENSIEFTSLEVKVMLKVLNENNWHNFMVKEMEYVNDKDFYRKRLTIQDIEDKDHIKTIEINLSYNENEKEGFISINGRFLQEIVNGRKTCFAFNNGRMFYLDK